MINPNGKKILLLTGLFYPDTFSGSGKLVYYHAQELIKQGFNVTVLTRKYKAESLSSENLQGTKIIRYSSKLNKIWGKSFTDIFILPQIIKKLWLKEKYDLAICYDHFQMRAFLKSKIKLPSIFVFQASYARELLVEGLSRNLGLKIINDLVKKTWASILFKIEKNNLKQADKIVALSEFSKKLVNKISQGQADEKVVIIPGGIDLQAFKPADKNLMKKELNLPLDKFIILTVRRLVGRTGVDNLILAADKLRQEFSNFLLVIIGEGILAEKLKTMAKDLNLSANVIFLGRIEENELIKYYQAADLFVLPTLAYEGFGLVTLEALACGTPVLGTPVGATPEILVKLDKSYVLADNQPLGIYQGIKAFKAKYEQLDELALKNKLTQFVAENYSWQKAGDLLVEEINRLI